jgi:SAM-dependent methyltransferase
VSVVLRLRSGGVRPLPTAEWQAPATPLERGVLRGLTGPVLDLGCGPGRLVAALAEMGTPALGVDSSPVAVEHARRLGAPVIQRSVFDALPGEGRWESVLLFDGNVGIGGDPVGLLRRLRALLAGGGRAVVEVEPPGADLVATEARLERDGATSPWFPWACVGADHLPELADQCGLGLHGWLPVPGRWLGVLTKEVAG